jgi:hypothetical protein
VMYDKSTADILVIEQVIEREREADDFRHLIDDSPDPMALYATDDGVSSDPDLASFTDDGFDDPTHGLHVVGA